ncbi:hypothetical protein OAH34_03425 [bacterium]|nr:hypothetical protein [bacterium]
MTKHRLKRIGFGALVGAISIHLMFAIAVLLKGIIFGWGGGEIVNPSMTPGSSDVAGWTGGVSAVNQLLGFYIHSLGVMPLMISMLGAFAGGWVTDSFFQMRKHQTVSVARTILFHASVAYLLESMTRMWVLFGTVLESGSGGLLFWLMSLVGCMIWLTAIAAASLRFRRINIDAALTLVGLGLWVMRSLFLIPPPPGTALAAVLMIVYHLAAKQVGAVATHQTLDPQRSECQRDDPLRVHNSAVNQNSSETQNASETQKASETQNPSETQKATVRGADIFAVFLMGGFATYAVICLLTLLASIGNRNSDNWGLFMPMVLGIWGIPVFGTIAAIVHTQTGPWDWCRGRSAWTNAAISFLACLVIIAMIIATQ